MHHSGGTIHRALTSNRDAAGGLVIARVVGGAARVHARVLLDDRQQTQRHVAELVRQRGARACRMEGGGRGVSAK